MKSLKFVIPALTAATFLFSSVSVNAQSISDKEIKKNPAPVRNSLSYVMQLQPLTFEFDQSKYGKLNLPSGQRFGFITDDVKQVLPGIITQQSKWYSAGKNNQRAVITNEVDYAQLVPLLVSAIKEQQAEIDELKAHLQQLKSK